MVDVALELRHNITGTSCSLYPFHSFFIFEIPRVITLLNCLEGELQDMPNTHTSALGIFCSPTFKYGIFFTEKHQSINLNLMV